MPRPRHGLAALATALASLSLIAGCGDGEDDTGTAPASAGSGAFDAGRAFADLEAQIALGPRPTGSTANAAQANLLADRLMSAGAKGVRIQHPFRNVVGTIPGEEPGYIVVGAHHDTKDGIEGFVGANDGASGVAVAIELARSLPRPFPGPSIAIALFDGEEAPGDRNFAEHGKRGSRQYVAYAARGAQGSPSLDEIEAMVLFDMVGDCDLHVPMEAHSDQALYEAVADADPEVFSGRTFPIDDDHTPFLERGIPAVDLIDFDYGPGPAPGEWWHTPEDTTDKVCPESLGAVGGAALQALPEIGGG